MLGRLFSTANSTNTSPGGTRPSTAAAPDSDELHTRGLLYPDTIPSSFQSCLSLSHSSNSSNNLGDNIDLDSNRDVRVIIAQDATASELKCVLYDSKPASKITEPVTYGAFDDGPLSPGLGGAYNRSRRRAAPSTQFHVNSSSCNQTQHASGNVAPEDEMRVLTDCMFGSAPLAYKGPSTKVHILPNVEEKKPTPASSRRGSLRAPSFTAYASHQSESSQKDKRKSVLITRLFSVVIPPSPPTTTYTAISREHTPTPASSVGSNHGFPFPKMTGTNSNSSAAVAGAKFVKPPKTSMYAVGLIISLPQPSQYSCGSTGSSIHRCCCCQQSSFSGYDSDHHQHEFCCPSPPSFDEDYQPPMTESLRMDGVFDDFPPPAADDRMDLITKHWDVINRALSDLQRVAQAQILNHLNAWGIASPQTACQNGYKYRKKVELRHGALMTDEVVRKEVERLRWRIVAGIRTPRVITGQGKWAVWKDEAKWANARFGGRDMNLLVAFPWLAGSEANSSKNSFFLTLLTAFLGHHTEWLDVLGPAPYRLKHQQQQQKAGGNGDECAIPTRTVLLASDKHAARRLIYLLSAFLPSKSLPPWDGVPPPSRTDSMNYLSQSPPVSAAAGGPGGKKSSLRKKAKKKPSKLSMVTREEDEPVEAVVGWDIPVAHGELNVAQPSLQLPLANPASKKAGAGTLATPSSATVVPTNAPGSPQKALVRPGSSSSIASMNLMNTLKRTGTANTSADSSGSFLSFWSFWSNTRSGSTAPSETSTQPDDMAHSAIKIADGRDEMSVDGRGLYVDDDDIMHHHSHHKHAHHSMSAPPLMPYGFHQQFVENEVRLSVDESDGIVDVDIPMPSMDYGTTFTSPISSPSSGGWAMSMMDTAGPGLMRSNSMSFSSAMLMPTWMPDLDDNGINVGGWMEDEIFHPDFALQAVKPYPEIEEDIKKAMRSEPTPPHGASNTPASENGTGQSDNKWVEVCSVLVVDTKRLQIKRLRLRRRSKKQQTVVGNQSPLPPGFPSALGGHRHLHVQHPVHQQHPAQGFEEEEEEEVMDEEIVCDVDDVLATAVEKVIGISGASRRKTGPSSVNSSQNMGIEVCKCMVLGALEDVVRAVAVDRGNVVGNVLTEGVAKWLSEVEESF